MVVIFVVLAAVAAVMLGAGIALGVMDRGRTTVRKGPEIYGEMMAESMHRDTLREGEIPIAQKVFATGKGVAWERGASYSVPEIKTMLREGNYRGALPALLVMAGLVGLPLFLGLAVLVAWSSENARIAGGILVAIGLYGGYMMARDMARE